MRYIDSNIFIHNLIGASRLDDVSERYLDDVAKVKGIAATSVHTIIEICVCDQKNKQKNSKMLEGKQ